MAFVLPMNSNIKELFLQAKLTAPLLLTYCSSLVTWLFGLAVVGRVGSDDLAALVIGGGIFFEVIAVAVTLLSLLSVQTSKAVGSRDNSKLKEMIGVGFWTSTLVAAVATLVTLFFVFLIPLASVDEELATLSQSYILVISLAIFPTLWFVAIRHLLLGVEDTKFLTHLSWVSMPLGILLTYLLTLGVGSFPGFGVVGAALAVVLTDFFVLLVAIWYLLAKKPFAQYDLLLPFQYFVARGSLVSSIKFLWKNTPLAGVAIIEGGVFALVPLIVAPLGTEYVVAVGIVFAVSSVAEILAQSIGEAGSIRIAYRLGASQSSKAATSTRLTFLLFVVLQAIFLMFVFLFPNEIVQLVLPGNDGASVTGLILAAGIVFIFFDSIQMLMQRILRAYDEISIQLWSVIIGYWSVALPTTWITVHYVDYGSWTVLLGISLGSIVSTVVLASRIVKKLKYKS